METQETVQTFHPVALYHATLASDPVVVLDELEEKYMRSCGWITADELFAEQRKAQERENERLQKEAEAQAKAAAEAAKRNKLAEAETAKIRKAQDEKEAAKQAALDAVSRKQELAANTYKAQKAPIEQRIIYLRERERALIAESVPSSMGGDIDPESHKRVIEMHGEILSLTAQLEKLEAEFTPVYNAIR